MTEYSYNVNKNCIEKNGNFVAYVDVIDTKRIIDLLNEQDNEIQRLKKELKNRKKLNNILEGFLLDKGYDFDDILKFLQDRTENGERE